MNKTIREPVLLLLLLITAAIKFFFVCIYRYPLEDLWHHQTLAINFANGYGVHYIESSVSDLSEWNKVTLYKWPPLVSVLIGSLSFVTKNTTAAVCILDVLSLMLIILSLRSIIRSLNFTKKQQWFCWFLFLVNPVHTDLFSTTDLLSLAFWCSGFSFFLSLFQKPGRSVIQLLSLIFILFIPAAFRYQYYPAIFFLPFSLLYMGWRLKNKLFIRDSLLLLAGLGLLLSIQIFALSVPGHPAAYMADEKGFSPENLVRMNPFFVYSFFPLYQFINFFAGSNQLAFVYQLAGLTSLMLFVLFIYILRKRSAATVAFRQFQYFSITSLLGLFLLLSALSLFYKLQINGLNSFTYVQETRYWGVAIFLIPLLLVSDVTLLQKKIISTFLIALITLNGFIVLHRLQKTYLQKDPSNTYAWQMKHKYWIADTIEKITAEKKLPIVVSAFDKDFAMYNSERPYAVAPNDSLLNNGVLSSSKPVSFFLITRKELTEKEKNFIQNNRLLLAGYPSEDYCLFRNQ